MELYIAYKYNDVEGVDCFQVAMIDINEEKVKAFAEFNNLQTSTVLAGEEWPII